MQRKANVKLSYRLNNIDDIAVHGGHAIAIYTWRLLFPTSAYNHQNAWILNVLLPLAQTAALPGRQAGMVVAGPRRSLFMQASGTFCLGLPVSLVELRKYLNALFHRPVFALCDNRSSCASIIVLHSSLDVGIVGPSCWFEPIHRTRVAFWNPIWKFPLAIRPLTNCNEHVASNPSIVSSSIKSHLNRPEKCNILK